MNGSSERIAPARRESPLTLRSRGFSTALIALLLGCSFRCSREPELPRLYPVPAAVLTSQDARPVDLNQFRGYVTVYDFIFTSCNGVCPMMTRNMKTLALAVDRAEPVRFVSISVDPERDTPQRLTRYANSTGRDSRWIFLTTSKDRVFELSQRGFKLSAGENAPAESDPVYHSPRFVLVDREGIIRGYYDATVPEKFTQLQRDIQRLTEEG